MDLEQRLSATRRFDNFRGVFTSTGMHTSPYKTDFFPKTD